MIHTIKGFGIVDKAEIDAFLELSYFLEKRKVSKLQGITSHKSEWPSSKSWQTINNKFWRGYGEKGNSKLLRSVFIPIPKKGNAKECSNCVIIALISPTSKVLLKILQASLQQYVNQELPDVQVGFRKGRGTRDQIVNIHCITEKAKEFQKNIYFCFIDYAKAFDYVDHKKLWKILKVMGIPDHLTCLLRNLYAGQEAIV